MTVRNSKIATSVWTALFILTISCGYLYATPTSSVSKSASARDNDDCEYRNQDGYYDWYPEGCEDDFPISTGWLIAIGIIALILTFGIPIGICFCCGCLCFKAFKQNKNPPATVYVQQPGAPGSYPQQQGYPAESYPQQQGYPAESYPQQQPYNTAGNPSQPNYGFVAPNNLHNS